MAKMPNLAVAALPIALLWGAVAAGASESSPPDGGAPASRTGEAREWLDRMATALERLNYVATFVYSNGDSLRSMQVVHRYDETGVRERMVSLSGPPREVLRDNAEVTCILPDDRAVLVAPSKPRRDERTSLFSPAQGLEQHYLLSTSTGSRVAGRPTQMVKVTPRDHYRYGYRLSLDLETALPLRSELIGEHGQALERIVYTNVELPVQITDEMLSPANEAEGYTWYRPAASATTLPPDTAAWRVNWLPQGFEPGTPSTRSRPEEKTWMHHTAYSDGVASLSVFIEQLPAGGEGMEGTSQMGAANAFGRVVHGVQVTVVGEVPSRTVQLVGRSVVREP